MYACNIITAINYEINKYLLNQSLFDTAPSIPRNITILSINSTAVKIIWNEPGIPNGVIRSYLITIYTTSGYVLTINHSNLSSLTVDIYGLTPNTIYTVNISAVTVEPGDAASLSFTTPSCKCVIVLMCYVMYCFY